MENVYQYINRSIVSHFNYTLTIPYQLPLSRRSGGSCMRSPLIFYPASKITSLKNKVEKIRSSVRYDLIDGYGSNMFDVQRTNISSSILAYNQIWHQWTLKHDEKYQNMIKNLLII